MASHDALHVLRKAEARTIAAKHVFILILNVESIGKQRPADDARSVISYTFKDSPPSKYYA